MVQHERTHLIHHLPLAKNGKVYIDKLISEYIRRLTSQRQTKLSVEVTHSKAISDASLLSGFDITFEIMILLRSKDYGYVIL